MTGVNSLVHQLQSTQKQSTFLLKAALWVKSQVQSSSLDVKRYLGCTCLFHNVSFSKTNQDQDLYLIDICITERLLSLLEAVGKALLKPPQYCTYGAMENMEVGS